MTTSVTRNAPMQTTQNSSSAGTGNARLEHNVEVGSVIQGSTSGGGSVEAKSTSTAQSTGINCVDPNDMLARLSNPEITGGATATHAYSISTGVKMDVVVDMKANANAAATVVGDVVKNQGKVEFDPDCGPGGTPNTDQDGPRPQGGNNQQQQGKVKGA